MLIRIANQFSRTQIFMESTQELVRKYLTSNEESNPPFESDIDDDESEYSLFAFLGNEYRETSRNTSTASSLLELGRGKTLKTIGDPESVFDSERNFDGALADFPAPYHSNYLFKFGLDSSAMVPEEFAKYLKLVGTSIQVLMLKLEEERRQNFELRRCIDGKENESQELQKLRKEHELLRSSYDSLAVKNMDLELNLKRLNPDYEKLTLETRLLREKLVKYKRLYEEKVVRDDKICAKEHEAFFSHPIKDAGKENSTKVIAPQEPKGLHLHPDKVFNAVNHELASSEKVRSDILESDERGAKALSICPEAPHKERILLSHNQKLIDAFNSMKAALDDPTQFCSHEPNPEALFLDYSCGPCSSTSALSSRPNSQSTPMLKRNASHELMGKHHWKTI